MLNPFPLTVFAEALAGVSLGVLMLVLALLGAGVLGTVNPSNPTAMNARNATGGPVKPATTRDYLLVTLFFTLAVAAIFVGLYFMNR